MSKIHAIVLAAGKGKRMNSKTLPKVLFPIAGKPMLDYVLNALASVHIKNPVIIVGFLGQKVIDIFGSGYSYARQVKRLGTAHAVRAAETMLAGQDGCTLIINGDQPFFRTSTLQRLIKAVTEQGATLAILSGTMHDAAFDSLGRVITDNEGHVIRIVEVKDATEEEKKVRLMNLGGYAADNAWLWRAIKRIKKSPATGEYYITDLVAEAVKEGKKVVAIEIEDRAEAIGINTLEHLAEAEQLWLAQQAQGK